MYENYKNFNFVVASFMSCLINIDASSYFIPNKNKDVINFITKFLTPRLHFFMAFLFINVSDRHFKKRKNA